MINKLIEKEIWKISKYLPSTFNLFCENGCGVENVTPILYLKFKALTAISGSMKTIAKEVAMKFKDEFETTDGMINFCDQIINEVSD